jgi:dTDP-4-dehydrorhamnose reductase
MRIIIIGASGLIGTALEAAALAAGHEVVGTYSTKPRSGLVHFDLERDHLHQIVPNLNFSDAVVLLSAIVDQFEVERRPDESRQINVVGAVNCAYATFAHRAHFVFASSEAVFGEGQFFGYSEDGEPRPISLYARQKVEVEKRAVGKDMARTIVRTGSVIGSENTCVVSTTYQRLLGSDARMAQDNLFTVVDVDDVAAGLLKICENHTVGTLHLTSNPPIARTELADLIMANSRFGGAMKYETFPGAPASGQRWAWMKNKYAVDMGFKFSDPHAVIRRKIALLDERQECRAA